MILELEKSNIIHIQNITTLLTEVSKTTKKGKSNFY